MFNTASPKSVDHHSLDVSEIAVPDLEGDPESRPDFQDGQHLTRLLLRPNKGPDLVGLKLADEEAFQHPIAEPGGICSRRFKPASDGVPQAIRLILTIADIAMPWTHIRTTSSNKDLGLCSR